jgi:DNA-binding MarR family transcriptional regulator
LEYSVTPPSAIPIVVRYNGTAVTKRNQRVVNYEALADFRYEIRRYLNFSERAARARGVEPHQHQALLALKGLPGDAKATVGVLAERLQIQHHSAVELTDRLVRRGFLRRSRSQADRREVLLHLTRSGENVVWELSLPHRAELRAAGRRLLRALEAALGEAEVWRASRASLRPVKKPQRERKKAASSR